MRVFISCGSPQNSGVPLAPTFLAALASARSSRTTSRSLYALSPSAGRTYIISGYCVKVDQGQQGCRFDSTGQFDISPSAGRTWQMKRAPLRGYPAC